jgi:hypothetical protein
MMDMNSNFTGTGGAVRCRTGLRLVAQKIPLNQQTIFRTFEGCNELLLLCGQGAEIIH